MKIVNMDKSPIQPVVNNPLFTGGTVTRQGLVGEDASKSFSMGVVNFSPGARNKFHAHSGDQVLLVTKGTGIVATDKEEKTVTVGDLIVIPAGEKHWHGATKTSAFSHITLTSVGSTTEQLEK